jgi:hypothetical protein
LEEDFLKSILDFNQQKSMIIFMEDQKADLVVKIKANVE